MTAPDENAPAAHLPVAVVLGGYGTFGRLVAASLARHAGIRLIVAGRNEAAAAAECRRLGTTIAKPAALDCTAADFATRLADLSPNVVIDTVGPFQARSHSVACTCVEIGAHCVDLADGREFVSSIVTLDEAARSRGVLVASGASTCPALSTAVADELIRDLSRVDSLEIAIAPGQKAPRGLATTRFVLGYSGKPIPAFESGRRGTRMGWSGIGRHRYPEPVGVRWLASVELPEMDLWPARYPTVRTLDTRASLESQTLFFGLAALARLVRIGAIRSLEPYALPMLRVAKFFERFGRDVGAMHVTATSGTLRRTWTIVAERGDGPQIPAMPAATLAKKLLGLPGYAPVSQRGAMPCIGLLTLDEMLRELERFAIRTFRDDRDTR